MSEYSVEQVDEDAMTEFIQSKRCRRVVLGRHMDGESDQSSCSQTDSVFCDRCKMSTRSISKVEVPEGKAKGTSKEENSEVVSGARVIKQRLEQEQARQEQMIEVMDQLQGNCIYCGLTRGEDSGAMRHEYKDCKEAEESRCGIAAYEAWREDVDLGQYQHCWKCGLPQKICRRLEDNGWCEYPEVMLPGMFILHRQQHLKGIAETAGFQGIYDKDI
jgi:hypothetical protein